MNVVKGALPVCVYTFAVGLVLQGWFSNVLPVSVKMVLTGVAVTLIGIGFLLQRRWRNSVRSDDQRAQP